MLEVRLLGQFEVRRDGKPILIPARAAQSLLAYLLLTAGTKHRREKLAGLLWPNTTDEKARSNLRHELWRLRKAIETKTPVKRAVSYFLVDEISIGFDPGADYSLDVAVVLQPQVAEVSADDLIGALSLYHGELLPGWYEDWVALERERVHAVFEQKMARLLELLVEDKRWQDTLEWGERWIALGQTPEPAYRALMAAHSALGNLSQVASVYERCRQAMRNDLGVDPSEQTHALFERLSRNRDGPDDVRSSVAFKPPSSQSSTLRESRHETRATTALPAVPRTSHLPVPLTSFIGREHEIEQVKRSLSATRLLTLVGSGGVGKTRLAIQLATELSSEYKDGAWWVALAALASPDLVPQAVAKALGVREVPNVPLIDTLADALCSMHALLVLDNCEHLVAACAQLAEDLLASCASLKILATSREALGISGETIWRVPSLSLPEPGLARDLKNLENYESVQLFVARARALKADFTLLEGNALAIEQICQRLDGIPLAIELAVARIKTLGVGQIAARLEDRFNLLTHGSRTALLRHQTLRATMDWSYDLLPDHERVLFRRLSVFAGGWTLEEAESVCAGDGLEQGQVLELLSRLVEKSLVIVAEHDGAARYRSLETIREYAREKLEESEEAKQVHDRHLRFYLDLAEEAEQKLFTTEQLVWLDRLETEHDNLRTAMQWALDSGAVETGARLAAMLGYFWWERGHHTEGFERLNQFLGRLPKAEGTGTQAKLLNVLGFTLWTRNDQTAARPLLEKALAMGRESGDMKSVAVSLQYLARVSMSQGQYAEARSYLEEGLGIWREMGARGKHGSGWSLTFLGDAALYQGDYERAQALYEESIPLLRELADNNLLSYALRRLGLVVLRNGDYQKASELCKESLILNSELGHKQAIANCLAGLAAVAMARGEMMRAGRLFGAAEALLHAIAMPLIPADGAEYDRNIAKLRTELGDATVNAVRAQGRAMSMEQAVAYALEGKTTI